MTLPTEYKKRICFNDQHLPFHIKVKDTVIAHLFEHILLEYLYLEKKALQSPDPCYNGLTQWNWHHDPEGLFHITINSGTLDKEIFTRALNLSLELIEVILSSRTISARA